MREMKSPIKQMRKRLKMTQADFAEAVGVSRGHMCEVDSGIAPLSEKIKDFLKDIFVDIEAVEKEHNAYMKYRQEQYRGTAWNSAEGKDG